MRGHGAPSRDMTLADELLALLVCPRCRGPLDYRPGQQRLACEACRLLYRIEEGIPVMLIDEAEAYGSEIDTSRPMT